MKKYKKKIKLIIMKKKKKSYTFIEKIININDIKKYIK
ncbi:MAG: DUF4295 domain-containing protein [Candidatus Shikimatogenerans bostrichidophilus]|nr:MAG: DUF4295 domain-containing protein [Candidatus Shikimatogenerans bostrichidophilus]